MQRALPREWCGNEITSGGVRRERPRLSRVALSAWVLARVGAAGLPAALRDSGDPGDPDGVRDRPRAKPLARSQGRARAPRGRVGEPQDLPTVQREAVERLGLVFPEAGQVVVVRARAGAARRQAAPVALTAARRD